ncbi:MAG: hypothetical protein WC979_00065 [Candidatus Pacearchaeota archaeon]|jgi:hypothetical protein|nr:hypothetical protein [Clostridia bacterium]
MVKVTAFYKLKELLEDQSIEKVIELLGNYMTTDELEEFIDFVETELE